MGAWGIEILNNDRAMDLIDSLTEMKSSSLRVVIGILLNSVDEEEAMLGVAIVDAALNGVDKRIIGNEEYYQWFGRLNKKVRRDAYHYKATARNTIKRVEENSNYFADWNDDCRQRRRIMVDQIYDRLK